MKPKYRIVEDLYNHYRNYSLQRKYFLLGWSEIYSSSDKEDILLKLKLITTAPIYYDKNGKQL